MYNQKRIVTELKKFEQIFSSWEDRTERIGESSFRLPWPTIAKRGDMAYSSFCQVEFLTNKSSPNDRQWESRFYEVTAHDSVIDTIDSHTINIEHDTMNFRLIEWGENQTLVTCSHSQIIGSVWVAVIDTDSIPRIK